MREGRITARQAREVLELEILSDMNNKSSGSFSRYDFFHNLSALGDPQTIPREMVRAICRDLTNRGLAQYQRGLWTEDGMPAGSGYGITRRGLAYMCALEEVLK